jgi:hypothetical protein
MFFMRTGSIHKEEYFDFWREDLAASSWVLDTLKNGYAIPFESEPGDYEEKNNASALGNMRIVREQVGPLIVL